MGPITAHNPSNPTWLDYSKLVTVPNFVANFLISSLISAWTIEALRSPRLCGKTSGSGVLGLDPVAPAGFSVLTLQNR